MIAVWPEQSPPTVALVELRPGEAFYVDSTLLGVAVTQRVFMRCDEQDGTQLLVVSQTGVLVRFPPSTAVVRLKAHIVVEGLG